LVGALHLVDQGRENRDVQVNEDRLIMGNQEDMGLIVALEETLILIEAKGATSWVNAQMASKIERLSAVLELQARPGGVPRQC
jgi:hypothetical protein